MLEVLLKKYKKLFFYWIFIEMEHYIQCQYRLKKKSLVKNQN